MKYMGFDLPVTRCRGAENDDERDSLTACLKNTGRKHDGPLRVRWYSWRLNWQWATPSGLADLIRKRRLP